MNIFQTIGNFIQKEVSKIVGDVPVITKFLESAATMADNIVNGLKDFAASPIGKDLEALIEVWVPAPLVNGFIAFLPTIIQDLGWVEAEFNKSPAQLVQDGLNYAINVPNPNVKATNLAVLAAHINAHLAAAQGAPISIQASLSQTPAIHAALQDPTLTGNAPAQ